MSKGIIRFEDMANIDKILYYQCREYIKLCLMMEDLQCFRNRDDEYKYDELMKDILFKANILLREFNVSLERIEQRLDDGDDV